MNMELLIQEQARLIILRALHDQASMSLNSDLLSALLTEFGINQPREWLFEQLNFLTRVGAIICEPKGSVRVAYLTDHGRDHVTRAVIIEGVKRPSPSLASMGVELISQNLKSRVGE